ncbi:unnamed protein product [Penicillium olsonii]|nr:unnamed protein product [Penicillium olsonii]
MGIHHDAQAAQAGSSTVHPLVQEFGNLQVLDDLIRLRAADTIQHSILAYPRFEKDPASYDHYSGRDLDDLINQAVIVLMEDGFKQPKQNGSTVALLTLSDFDMVITFFALTRLGYTVMMLSPRLSGEACVSLLDAVNSETIIYGNSVAIRSTLGDILRRKLVSCRPIVTCERMRKAETSFLILYRNKDPERVALILHSSGSTGTPKPLFLTHRALMTHPLRGPGLTSFNPLPWYHLHGLSTALQAMWMRKTAYMWNAALPLTVDFAVAALQEAQPQSVAAVPYMLQILIDDPRGIEALRKCQLVTYGGAPCPDELGDHLVREGIRLGGAFGLTEAGLVAESISRPEGDPHWNYLRFFDNVRPYVWMKPVSKFEPLYECVYLAGHPALTTSNSSEPPGSFHSKDVFTPHPTIAGRWKYMSRLDDRVNLANGEKVLPLPIEGCIKQHHLIHDAVLVGVGKSAPGLVLVKADSPVARKVSESQYINLIWPIVQEANSRAEAFSQISRDLIAVLPHDAQFPRTDKGSMIRAQFYDLYHDLIEGLCSKDTAVVEGLELRVDETEEALGQLARDELGIPMSTFDAKFFSEGVDSLKAIHFRRLILQRFRFDPDNVPGSNIIFEAGNISTLARIICELQKGNKMVTSDDGQTGVLEMVKKYSMFHRHIPRSTASSSNSVVSYIFRGSTSEGVISNIFKLLTGGTGSLGAHVLFELLIDDSISTVYCLTRRETPLEDITESLASKELSVSPQQLTKIVALNSNLDQPEFGLAADTPVFQQMLESVSLIIHTAWPVNFNLPLSVFESHVQGLYNLIQFSLSVHRQEPAVTLFCSSISTALGSQLDEIPEEPVGLECALAGYGQSKLAGERIVSQARHCGARAYSLRIGQVSGHSEKGLWNDSEAIPLMIRSAVAMGSLPELPGTCSWLPVDKAAATILELAKSCNAPGRDGDVASSSSTAPFDDSIFNVCNPRKFTWLSLLGALKDSGFQFETLPLQDWLSRLRESEARGEELVNPAIKLIRHYESMYGSDSFGAHKESKKFVTIKAEGNSATLREGRLDILEDGILRCYAEDWLARWTR